MAKPSRSRRRTMRPRFDHLEAKQLLAVTVFQVTDPGDTTTGQTLRAAILAADAGPGQFAITFNLPAGTTEIQPATPLPTITAANLLIDGTTQPGAASKPVVTIDGTNAGAGANGFAVTAAGVKIAGLSIGHFSGAGVAISGPGSDTVAQSYIGVDATGKVATPNGQGVLINNSPNNVVGGVSAAAAGDLISGNTGAGIAITGALARSNVVNFDRIGVDSTLAAALANGVGITEQGGFGNVIANSTVSSNTGGGISLASGTNNVVQSTFVGTGSTGEVKLGNGQFGIRVSGETVARVGIPGFANIDVVSNNQGPGIDVAGSNGTTVANSFVGLDRAGIAPMGNTTDGVLVELTSTGTTVGGAAGSGDFIAGNTNNGVDVVSSSTGTVIQGNHIGSDISGLIGIPNGQNGIQLNQTNATIKADSILDNGQSGVLLFGGSGSLVQNNFIGDVASGTHGNALDGVFIFGSNNNTIGGAAAGNFISANADYGITIESGSQNNLVAGNYIGLSGAGQGTRGNENGIAVFDSTGTTIGGLTSGSVNYIGGNSAYGIDVHGTDSTGTLISGNFIGIQPNGTVAAPNASGIILDGTSGVMVQGNIVSGNTVDGIFVNGGSGSTIRSNLIGTDTTGRAQLGNGGDGVDIVGASHITVGGTTAGATNVISANHDYGIHVSGTGASANTLVGDWIGVDLTGSGALENFNGLSGIFVDNVPGTTIGGSATAYNVIGFNSDEGILISGKAATGTNIFANKIGLGADGVTAAGNGMDGILVQATPGVNIAFNYISENTDYGVHIASGAPNAAISANLIGTDVTGTIARGNGLAGVLLDGTSGAVVGGTGGAATRNIISGNGKVGVFIFGATAKGNLIAGDFIGLNASGTGALGNGGDGILLQAPSNVVGGVTAAARNVISANGSAGIHVIGGGTGNVLAGDWIGTDASGSRAVGNNFYGIFVDGSGTGAASGNLIGGGVGSTNVIAASGVANIDIVGLAATGNLILGNSIGTDATGTNGLFPTPYGIALISAPGNTIGGTGAGQGNTISGQVSAGISIMNNGASRNLIIGNVIGRGATGAASRANNVGVLINNAPNNIVGRLIAAAFNLITGNIVNEIEVVGAGATGNQTDGNTIGPDA